MLYIAHVAGDDRASSHYTELNVPHPIAVAIEKAGPALGWLTYFVKIGAIAGLSSVMLVMLLGQPRIFYTMSKDGLLPPVVREGAPKFQTPYITTIVTGRGGDGGAGCSRSACSASWSRSARCSRS